MCNTLTKPSTEQWNCRCSQPLNIKEILNMDIQHKLLEYENKLINTKRYIFFNNDWKQTFPNHSGVYVVWENEQPIYVGETSGLKSRMSPLNYFLKYICCLL